MNSHAELGTAELARFVQHTRIEVGLTRDDLTRHCEECVTYGFDAAMVAGSWVPLVAGILEGTGITVASALDFPTVGIMTTAGKAAEAAELVRLGARELDTGVQIGWLRSGRYTEFRDDIAAVVRAAGVPVKVMLELPLLTPEERDAAVDLSVEAGARYVKNASGGAVGTATPEDIRYLRDRVPDGIMVKASGGIKSRDQAVALLDAGADRLGTSAGVGIVGGGQVAAHAAY